MLIALIYIAWYLSGVASYIYWLTEKNDFVVDDLSVAFLAGFAGIFTFLISWYIYRKGRIIVKRRK